MENTMTTLIRRIGALLTGLMSGLALVACWAPHAQAQSWPAKPVKMVVSTGPGLATDTVARLLAERLSRAATQQFVVENMAGAGGIIAAQSVARSAPDGYTILFTGGGTLVTNLFAFKSLPYDPARDFAPVALITESGGFVVSVNPSLPARSFAEFVSVAKARPGQLSYAVDTSNIYAVILGKLINKTAGVDLAEIPYKSTPQALQDTVAGRTQVIISAVAPTEPFVRSGKLRRIAISSAKRNPTLPDLPTLAETTPTLQVDGGGFSVVAPAGTPAEVVQRLNRLIAATLKDPDFGRRLLSLGQVAASGASAEAVAEYLRGERERWGRVFDDLGIAPQ
jgi:tripartite-type tricarboxylate transporter receptor subunit TctC